MLEEEEMLATKIFYNFHNISFLIGNTVKSGVKHHSINNSILSYWRKQITYFTTPYLSSTNTFNSDKNKILSFGKEFCAILTLFLKMTYFDAPAKKDVRKHCGKQKKCW